MSKPKSGGGANSNKVAHSRGVATGAPTQRLTPKAAPSVGAARITSSTPPLGNELATQVGKGGPGADRTVHATGSQGQHGGGKGR